MTCVGSVWCEILLRRKLSSQRMPDNERHTDMADMGLADICWLCRPTEAAEQNEKLNELGFVYYAVGR
jgi:hypothetical protein